MSTTLKPSPNHSAFTWLIEPLSSEEAQMEELLQARPPCARSSSIVHKQGSKEVQLRKRLERETKNRDR
jgi:hypothetical protein